MKTRPLGIFKDLVTAVKAAADYWGSTTTYYHTENPKVFLLKNHEADKEIGTVKEIGKHQFALNVRPKDPIFESIEHGDSITVVNDRGQRSVGKAILCNWDMECWVCSTNDNSGFIASGQNIVQIKRDRKIIYGSK